MKYITPIGVGYSSIAESWEEALRAVLISGVEMPTQYDKEGDQPSREIVLFLNCNTTDINVHRCLPGGLDDLFTYVDSVVYGTEDHLINDDEGKWSYTYHERLWNYPAGGGFDDFPYTLRLNQIQYIIDTLVADERSRRAQAILWSPKYDMGHSHPPCLSRLHFRLQDNILHMNAHMRSNDAFKASMMNMYAFVMIQKYVAQQLGFELSKKISTGRYTHVVDCYHVYGKDIEIAERALALADSRRMGYSLEQINDNDIVYYSEEFLKHYVREEPKWQCSNLILAKL